MAPPAALAALRHREFRRVFAAGFLAHTGNWMQNTGRAYLVYDITGSPAALGTIFFFTYVPQLLFSLFGGLLADRYDRRRLLLVVQSCLLGSALGMGALAQSGAATIVNVAAVSFVTGMLLAAQMPVTNALVPALVRRADLSSAVSLNAASNSAARIVGPLLVGVVVPVWGVAWLFWLNALSMPLLLLAWLRTPVTVRARTGDRAVFAAVADGIRYARSTPAVAVPIAVVAVLSGVGLVYQPLAVVYATDVLADGDDERGATLFGLLQAALGAGSVLGVLGFARAGLHNLAWVGLFPLSSVTGGFVAGALGVRPTITGAGLVCLAFCVVVARWRRYLRAMAVDPSEELRAVPALGEDS